MSLSPPYPDPEKILLFGDPGTGKTTSWIDIATFYARFNPNNHIYVLDTDAAATRMLHGKNLPNVIVQSAYDWPEYKFPPSFHPDPNDWIIVDLINSAWDSVQQYFADQVFQQNLGDYFLQARKSFIPGKDERTGKQKQFKTLEGWTDWNVINALYRDWINPLVLRPRCHLLACASLAAISERNDDEEIVSVFQRYGGKPAGQKHLPRQFHTILLTQFQPRPLPGAYLLTTAGKDRERPLLVGQPNVSFTRDYLMKVAGWQVS